MGEKQNQEKSLEKKNRNNDKNNLNNIYGDFTLY